MTETARAQVAANPDSDVSLTIVRILRAPIERVFDALTNPAALARWWGPEGCTTPDPQVDLRVGGHYRLDIHGSEGNVHELSGRYLEIDPPHRLRFTWTWGQGSYAGVETVVSIALRDHRDGTELTLLQTGFSTQPMADDHDGGWAGSLNCLDAYLQQGDRP